mmetsp:Transcript_130366/g.194011  ORF Transcript_130366/g.194011 Transcript_130366/m.194011 type:complete len:124 (-) Transcript_130366:224-595(-)
MFGMSFLSGIFEEEQNDVLKCEDDEIISVTSGSSEEFEPIPLKKNSRRRIRQKSFSPSRKQRRRDMQIKIACQSIKRHVVDNISSTRHARAAISPVSPDDIDGILNDLVWEEFRCECSLRSRR